MNQPIDWYSLGCLKTVTPVSPIAGAKRTFFTLT